MLCNIFKILEIELILVNFLSLLIPEEIAEVFKDILT